MQQNQAKEELRFPCCWLPNRMLRCVTAHVGPCSQLGNYIAFPCWPPMRICAQNWQSLLSHPKSVMLLLSPLPISHQQKASFCHQED